MRRQDRAIADEEAWDLLRRAEYGVLSTVGPDGAPYGVPLSFCIDRGSIYLHCALEGRKLDDLANEDRVSFCVVGETEVMPEKFGTKYESVIVTGRAAEIFGDDKQAALEAILRKYSPGFFDEGLGYIGSLRDKTRVFRVGVDRVSGKARRR